MALFKIIIFLLLILFLNVCSIKAKEPLTDYYDDPLSNELMKIDEKKSHQSQSKTRMVNEKEMVNDLVNKLKNIYIVSSRPR
jgi:hypothetical protein